MRRFSAFAFPIALRGGTFAGIAVSRSVRQQDIRFRALHFKDSSSIPESAFAAHFHWVFHCVIPESQLSGVLARR